MILQRVLRGEMPPSNPLTEDDRNTIKRWIEAGAPWSGAVAERRAGPDWWSLQPLRVVTPPNVEENASASWSQSPVDRFILAKLRQNGLNPSPPAGRRELIRRLSFDLIGLPPSPEEIDAFLNDQSPNAYEKLVDRLLASPHYGERWGRHWLDVARFSESEGFERDLAREHTWA